MIQNPGVRVRASIVIGLALLGVLVWMVTAQPAGAEVDTGSPGSGGATSATGDLGAAGATQSGSDDVRWAVVGDERTVGLRVRVMDPQGAAGCPGVAVHAFPFRSNVAGRSAIVTQVVRAWDRTLVQTKQGTIGVPTPKRLGLKPFSARGGRGDSPFATSRTDAAGQVVLMVPSGWSELEVVATDGGRSVAVVVQAPVALAEIAWPRSAQHRYQLLLGSAERESPEHLFAVHAPTQSVVEMTRWSALEFLGPVPGEWVPFLLPASGWSVEQPLDLRDLSSPTSIPCAAMHRLEVVDAESDAPIRALRILTLDAETYSPTDCQVLRSARGVFFVRKSSRPTVRLIESSCFRSAWAGGEEVRMELVAGADPPLTIQSPAGVQELQLEVYPVAPGSRSARHTGLPALRVLAHRGEQSVHPLPVGTYVLVPRDRRLPGALVDHGSAGSRFSIEPRTTMFVIHEGEMPLRASDRLGRTVGSKPVEEGKSVIEGLAFGPVLVTDGSESRVFEFSRSGSVHRFEAKPAPAELDVILPDGWQVLSSNSKVSVHRVAADQETADFRHRNGSRARLLWKGAAPSVRLPETFRELEVLGVTGKRGSVAVYDGPLSFSAPITRTAAGWKVWLPNGLSSALALVRTAEGQQFGFVPSENPAKISVPSPEASTPVVYASIAVDPVARGVHVLIMWGRSRGTVIDSVFATKSEIWSARIPRGSTERAACQVVTISERGMLREKLTTVLRRGAVRVR